MRLTRQARWKTRITSSPEVLSFAGRRRTARSSVVLWLLLVLGLLTVLPGCTRRFFRERADREVIEVLDEKDDDPRWALHDYYVYPHPLARFADPTDPDHPPMPPDDPAAWFLSPKSQRPKEVYDVEGTGYLELLAAWDAENRAWLKKQEKAQPPPPTAPLPPAVDQHPENGNGEIGNGEPEVCGSYGHPRPWTQRREPYIINLEQALELASINSREYQARREDLYLSALPVTLERFAFAPQFEATNSTIRTWAGREVGDDNTWTINSNLGVSKLFSTGALLLVDFANRTVINLTGNDKHTLSQSTLTLDFVQPLLRGGGRAVTLEPLTQSERNLLYQLRNYARFQKEFFVSIAAGAGQLAGGGGGDFGGLQLTVRGQAAQVGYYPTLQRLVALQNEIRNEQKLATLRRQFQALARDPVPPPQGGIRPLQVAQVEQDRRTAQSTIIRNDVQYNDALDQFKIQLGLPTDLALTLDDSELQPLRHTLMGYERIIGTSRELVRQVGRLDPEAEDGMPAALRRTLRNILQSSDLFSNTLRDWDRVRYLQSGAVPLLAPLAAPGPSGVAPLSPATGGLPLQQTVLQMQRQELESLLDKYEEEDRDVPIELTDRLGLIRLELDLTNLELALLIYERRPWEILVDKVKREELRERLFERVTEYFSDVLTQVKSQRLNALATTWPELPPIRVDGIDLLELMNQREMLDEAQNLVGQTALINRLDLMNQRAQLVDSWRDIAVFANSLLGTFDVRYNMQVVTPPLEAQPLNFDAKRGRQQLILNTQLPLVRKLERNNYRASLIAYQRQRRGLMATEDQILFQVRQNLRQLAQLAREYRIQQVAVDLAHRTVDNALQTIEQGEGDPAGQTQQLLNNVRNIPRTENNLFNAWISYNTTRMELYRDLELMQVDSRGVWIDEFASPDRAPRPGQTQPNDRAGGLPR